MKRGVFIRTRAEQYRYSESMPRIGPLVAYPLTPRGEDGRLLTTTFEQLVDTAITAGANAVGVLGSTGGFAYMPRSARKRITRSAVEVADGRVPVIVGVGALSTAEVLANLAEAHSVGASGALLQPMAYQPLTFDEIYGLYSDASAATEIPLWVYNNPSTTGHRFSVEQLAKIARLSAVAGFKDRAANATDAKDRMDRIAAALPPRTARQIDWGFSGDGHGAQVLLAGATAWHSGLAGVLPEICAAIAQAATSGHAPHARVLQRQLTPLSIIVRQYGGIRTAHSIAETLGLDAGVLPRPLAPLPADARTLVQMALDGISVPDAPTAEQEAALQAEADETAAAEKIVVESRAAARAAAQRAADAEAAAEKAAAERAIAENETARRAADATVAPATATPATATPTAEPSDAAQVTAVQQAGTDDETVADQTAPDQTSVVQAAPDQAAPDQAAPDQSGPATAGPDQAAAGQIAAHQAAADHEASEEGAVSDEVAPVARRAAPARTRSAARTAGSAATVPGAGAPGDVTSEAVLPDAATPGDPRSSGAPRSTAAGTPVATPAAEVPVQAVRRPEPTKTGAVMVAPDPSQQTRPAPVRSDGGAAVPPVRSLGRSRTEQPRRVRTPPTPVMDDDETLPDESTAGQSGRHSG